MAIFSSGFDFEKTQYQQREGAGKKVIFKGCPWSILGTILHRVAWVNGKRAHEIHQSLHAQYGECVQFGPNMVSISDPGAIPFIYPMRPGFPKVGFHLFQDLPVNSLAVRAE